MQKVAIVNRDCAWIRTYVHHKDQKFLQNSFSHFFLGAKCSYLTWSVGRDARWYIFLPKIPIWLNFGVPWNGKCWYIDANDICTYVWYILRPLVILYFHLVYIHTLWSFGIIILFWYAIARKSGNPGQQQHVRSKERILLPNLVARLMKCTL
jgi:hypothetical protein